MAATSHRTPGPGRVETSSDANAHAHATSLGGEHARPAGTRRGLPRSKRSWVAAAHAVFMVTVMIGYHLLGAAYQHQVAQAQAVLDPALLAAVSDEAAPLTELVESSLDEHPHPRTHIERVYTNMDDDPDLAIIRTRTVLPGPGISHLAGRFGFGCSRVERAPDGQVSVHRCGTSSPSDR